MSFLLVFVAVLGLPGKCQAHSSAASSRRRFKSFSDRRLMTSKRRRRGRKRQITKMTTRRRLSGAQTVYDRVSTPARVSLRRARG